MEFHLSSRPNSEIARMTIKRALYNPLFPLDIDRLLIGNLQIFCPDKQLIIGFTNQLIIISFTNQARESTHLIQMTQIYVFEQIVKLDL